MLVIHVPMFDVYDVVPFGNGSFLREKTRGAAMRVNIMARMKAKWNESTDFVI